ncbi:hypothetical protein TI39_contig384g00013 [Zymoseptoria brevis]|uniref:SET domain-containing protein n=1 Tax=Zymoseptoria brevis TaxID=1047168 RepID=A0A0F4GN82_9PEZI|nr:hypothetical protein TI39_contig384g00013 [Zymoseptoria brevis]
MANVIDLTGDDENENSSAVLPLPTKPSKTSNHPFVKRSNNMESQSPQAQVPRMKSLNHASNKEESNDRSRQSSSARTEHGSKPGASGPQSLAARMAGGGPTKIGSSQQPSKISKESGGNMAKTVSKVTAKDSNTSTGLPQKRPLDASAAKKSSAPDAVTGSPKKKRRIEEGGENSKSTSPAKKLKSTNEQRRQPDEAARSGNHLSTIAGAGNARSTAVRETIDLRSSPEEEGGNRTPRPVAGSTKLTTAGKDAKRSPLKGSAAARDRNLMGKGAGLVSKGEISVPESPVESPRKEPSPIKQKPSKGLGGENSRAAPAQSDAKSAKNSHSEGRATHLSPKKKSEVTAASSESSSTARPIRASNRTSTPPRTSGVGSPHKGVHAPTPRREQPHSRPSSATPRPLTASSIVAHLSVEGPDGMLKSENSAGRHLSSRNGRPAPDSPQKPGMPPLNSSIKTSQPSLDVTTGESMASDLGTSGNIAKIVEQAVEDLRNDHEYWNGVWLKRACFSSGSRIHRDPDQHSKPTSVFKKMKPLAIERIPEKKKVPDSSVRIHVEISSGKLARSTYAVPCTVYRTPTDADVPNYSHYVSIKHNFLANSERTLQHWPYFDDDFARGDALGQHYHVDMVNRERKLIRLAQAESVAEYAEEALHQIGCSWSDVLHFLLESSPNVGSDREARALLSKRNAIAMEDLTRRDERWVYVLSKLPAADPDTVGKAALLCDHFYRIARFPLWHVVRRSDYFTKLLEEESRKPDMDELTCRICMRFHCPYHGELVEHSPSDDELPEEDEAIVQTDIIHPPRINHRSRVTFPTSVDEGDPNVAIKDRRAASTWLAMTANLNTTPETRGPFYPCHHPGESCVSAKCSCWRAKITCEKICSCAPSCPRKFQGCSCSIDRARANGGTSKKNQKYVCFEDARCACFQSGRECDPDLCGDCGVCDILNPVHRHDDRILQARCRNASIQRGVPKHTILGDSGVHGLGLYACEDIRAHEYVGEYKGEIITKEEADRRGSVYEHQKLSYLFSLNQKQEIDSTYFGTKIRFINHAGDGKGNNLYPRIIMVNTVYRIALYASRYIRAGEELFFDYGPMFPDEQLGGKERKAAPHVRNANLVREFDEVENDTEDENGVRRARKAVVVGKRVRPSGNTVNKRQRLGENGSGPLPRKSRGDGGETRRMDDDGEQETGLGPRPRVVYDAGALLSEYNISEELAAEADSEAVEDDDFEPDDSSERSRDGASEESEVEVEDEEEDEEDGGGRRRQRRLPRKYRDRI